MITLSYYEEEILKELDCGNQYTSRQLAIFVVENSDSIVISKDNTDFDCYPEMKHKVIQKLNGYVHSGSSRERKYYIPNKSQRIYYVERL